MYGLTWDFGILGVLALLTAYSLFVRKHKALATLVSIYVAYFIATGWGERVAEFFRGDRVAFSSVWVRANLTSFSVQVALLVLFTVLLSTFMKLGGRRSRYSLIEVIAYSVCTVALGLLFLLLLMPEEIRTTTLASSQIAPYVFQWREYVLVVPVFVMVYFGIYGDEDL